MANRSVADDQESNFAHERGIGAARIIPRAIEDDYPTRSSLANGNDTSLTEGRTFLEVLHVLQDKIQQLELAQKAESGRNDAESSTDIHHDHGDSSKTIIFIPETRKVNYAQYKNRACSDECRYIIEILASGPLLEKKIQQELQDRYDYAENRTKGSGAPKAKKKTRYPSINLVDKAIHSSDSDSRWSQRIRINSPALLQILSQLCGERWSTTPRSFPRPFKLMIRLQEKVREVLHSLESRSRSSGTSTPVDTDETDSQNCEADAPRNDDPLHFAIDDLPETIEHLRCYVNYVDSKVIPKYRMFEDLNSKSPDNVKRVRFEDLWYLFRTGDIVYLPSNPDPEQRQKSSIRQSAWRVYSLHTPMDRYKVQRLDHRRSANEDTEGDAFRLWCYYIDYTGENFGPVIEEFKILRFEGKQAIDSLSIFPFRFVDNHEASMRELTRQGQEFVDCIRQNHRTYKWWTNPCTPNGGPVTDSDGLEIKHSQYIHSDVIVDFIEAFRVWPSWKPKMANLQPVDINVLTTSDEITIREWSGPDRAKLLSETPEILQLRTGVAEADRNKYIREDPFLKSLRDYSTGQGNGPGPETFRDEDLCLLPARVFAYVLRDRKFVQLDARHLKKVLATSNGFDNLKISRDSKGLIEALVNAHFMNKKVEHDHGVDNIGQDLITGKGKGLVILLHGVPGVGKTATAEAVAQTSGKPLFPITCGDLGIKPKEVEDALQEIFRLASLWDAILLLDEVDTFFSQRSRHDSDIVRNALVAVFLRALEYYNGILFLTTNRIGSLDEAFKSRVQVQIYYPPLEENQTMEIWQMNIDRLRMIDHQRRNSTGELPLQIYASEIMRFAKEHYQKAASGSGRGRWNGRQIRNAFQIAAALAYYENRRNYENLLLEDTGAVPSPPVLGVPAFKTMAELTSAFDDYVYETLGQSHGDLAYNNNERFDDFTQSHPTMPSPSLSSSRFPLLMMENRGNRPDESNWYPDGIGREYYGNSGRRDNSDSEPRFGQQQGYGRTSNIGQSYSNSPQDSHLNFGPRHVTDPSSERDYHVQHGQKYGQTSYPSPFPSASRGRQSVYGAKNTSPRENHEMFPSQGDRATMSPTIDYTLQNLHQKERRDSAD